METGDLLRLAWEADHDGRPKLRDSVLTLAVAESSPGDGWAERCRSRLVADRPDHFFAHFASVGQAMGDPRVVEARDRLRAKYPEAKVQSLLLRAQALRGPYLGRSESLDAMIDDLAGSPAEAENVRLDAPQTSRGPLNRHRVGRPLAWSLAYPSIPSGLEAPADWGPGSEPGSASDAEEFTVYYLTVLLAIAFLLASVRQASEDPAPHH